MESNILFMTVGIFFLFAWIFKTNRFNRLINKVPGPNTYPIVGNLLTFLVPPEQLLSTFQKLHTEFGDIYRTWQGSRPVIHLVSPETIEVVLSANNKHIRKGAVYKFLLPWLGTGLLTSADQKWFHHRKLISPTFHFKVLESFIDVFNECSLSLVRHLSSRAKGNDFFDIYSYITRCALDIICETAMGTAIHAQDNEHSPFVAATLKASELIVKRQFQVWLHPDIVYYNTKGGKEFKRNLKILHNFTEKVIRERKERRRVLRSIRDEADQADTGIKRRLAFLDLLLDAEEGQKVPLSDLEIREEVDTFMFEGHDTTTTAISWTLLLLGNHPKIQEAVRDELRDIFKGEDRPVTLRDLGEMKLLERVIKEALRLYPSVSIISRILDEDVQLGKYLIPAQTNIAIHIFGLHRHPQLYSNPLKFDPDRFLPENMRHRHPYAYLPFSAGQRNCIGQKFAMFEEKVMLSSILRNFEVKSLNTPEQVPTVHELVNRPLGGVHVQLTLITPPNNIIKD